MKQSLTCLNTADIAKRYRSRYAILTTPAHAFLGGKNTPEEGAGTAIAGLLLYSWIETMIIYWLSELVNRTSKPVYHPITMMD
jgi:hypothetical protein